MPRFRPLAPLQEIWFGMLSSRARMQQIVFSAARLSLGEAVSRLAIFAVLAYVSRVYGVRLLGTIVLAQVVGSYVMLGTDQGLCLIGARAIAADHGRALVLLRPLTRKRVLLCLVSVGAGVLYALAGPVPSSARLYVVGFVVAMLPYSVSLNWVAWGLDRMGVLGLWQATTGVIFAAGAIAWMQMGGSPLAALVTFRIAAWTAGAALLWFLWRRVWRRGLAVTAAAKSAVNLLGWRPTLSLGAAALLKQSIDSVSLIVLAGMATTAEVGRYGAAYKIVLLIFAGYWIVIRSLYPHFAAVQDAEVLRRRLLYILLPLAAGAGMAVAGFLYLLGPQLLTWVYGSTLGSTAILRLLVWSIPLEFCLSLLGNALASRGRDGLLLALGGAFAGISLACDFAFIPSMGALGAAWATLGAYVISTALVTWVLSRRGALSQERRGEAAGAA